MVCTLLPVLVLVLVLVLQSRSMGPLTGLAGAMRATHYAAVFA